MKTALRDHHHGNLDAVKAVCTYGLKDVLVADFYRSCEESKTLHQKCDNVVNTAFTYASKVV